MQETDIKYELLIHDDASSDSTPEIIRDYANRYPDKIIPILQTENQFSKGWEINAKILVPKARGKYFAFLDADDYWIDPHKLNDQVAFMEAHPETSMCFTASKHIFPETSKKPRILRYRDHDAKCSFKDVILLGGRLVDMGTTMVRRSIFDDLPEWYYYSQLWDLSVPLLSLLHGEIQYLNKVTLAFRYNTPGSWTQNNVRSYDRRRENFKKSIKLTDAFDQTTNQKYHDLIERKHDSMIVEIVLLSSPGDPDFQKYYTRLSLFKKFEYRLFKMIGSFWLWQRYRHILRFITGY